MEGGPEMRRDCKDGNFYSRAEFVAHYGPQLGAQIWDEAVDWEERRRDNDGMWYSKHQFRAFYNDDWLHAWRCCADPQERSQPAGGTAPKTAPPQQDYGPAPGAAPPNPPATPERGGGGAAAAAPQTQGTPPRGGAGPPQYSHGQGQPPPRPPGPSGATGGLLGELVRANRRELHRLYLKLGAHEKPDKQRPVPFVLDDDKLCGLFMNSELLDVLTAQRTPQTEVLTVELQRNTIGVRGAEALCAALRDVREQLSIPVDVLVLTQSKADDQVARILAAQLLRPQFEWARSRQSDGPSRQPLKEVHLSHNRLSADGVASVVASARGFYPADTGDGVRPLQLRAEGNCIADPDALRRALHNDIGSTAELPFFDSQNTQQIPASVGSTEWLVTWPKGTCWRTAPDWDAKAVGDGNFVPCGWHGVIAREEGDFVVDADSGLYLPVRAPDGNAIVQIKRPTLTRKEAREASRSPATPVAADQPSAAGAAPAAAPPVPPLQGPPPEAAEGGASPKAAAAAAAGGSAAVRIQAPDKAKEAPAKESPRELRPRILARDLLGSRRVGAILESLPLQVAGGENLKLHIAPADRAALERLLRNCTADGVSVQAAFRHLLAARSAVIGVGALCIRLPPGERRLSDVTFVEATALRFGIPVDDIRCTTQSIYDAAREFTGSEWRPPAATDPCPWPVPDEWAGQRYDGLKADWRELSRATGGRLYVNPPFSRMDEWMDKAQAEVERHGCEVLALVPSWGPWADSAVARELRGKYTHKLINNALFINPADGENVYLNVHLIWMRRKTPPPSNAIPATPPSPALATQATETATVGFSSLYEPTPTATPGTPSLPSAAPAAASASGPGRCVVPGGGKYDFACPCYVVVAVDSDLHGPPDGGAAAAHAEAVAAAHKRWASAAAAAVGRRANAREAPPGTSPPPAVAVDLFGLTVKAEV